MIMVAIYWLAWALVGAYFFRRRIDALTLSFLSCTVYFLPAGLPVVPIELGAYVIYLSVYVLLLVATVGFDAWVRRARRKGQVDVKRMRVYFRGIMLIYVPILLAYMALGTDAVVTSKGEGGGLLYYALSVVLGYLFVASTCIRSKLGIAVSLANYAWFVVTGDRTQFVIAVLAAFIFYAAEHPISLKGVFARLRPYQSVLLLAFVFVGLFGKNVYGAYYDWNAGREFKTSLVTRFQDMATSPSSGFEPYHVQTILNLAVARDDRVDSYYLASIPVQLLPFAGDLGTDVHEQSKLIKEMYFPGWSDQSGVSSNFFAEGFLLWGYGGALLFACLYVFVLLAFSAALHRSGVVARLWLSFGAVFWAFYLHRSSLLQMISHEKRIIYSIIVVVIVAKMLHTLLKARPGYAGPPAGPY